MKIEYTIQALVAGMMPRINCQGDTVLEGAVLVEVGEAL